MGEEERKGRRGKERGIERGREDFPSSYGEIPKYATDNIFNWRFKVKFAFRNCLKKVLHFCVK
jgi:hypothetical protein